LVTYGETPEAAAIREVREETGLEIRTQRLVETRIENYRRPQGVDRLLSLYYIGQIVGGREQPGMKSRRLAGSNGKRCRSAWRGPTWRSFGHTAAEGLDR